MPADLQKARDLFLHAVGKLPPEQWDAYVAEACGADADLRHMVGQFLQVHREAGSFLDRPAAEAMGTGAFVSYSSLATPYPREQPGTVIGPYKLLQQIGEGGMGVVWMAEQTEPVKRKVALKVIKPGMDSRQVIARFEAERQALAMMDHVNIARVFDGGSTDGEPSRVSDRVADGDDTRRLTPLGSPRPYFVMELVHGVPITKYCDDNHLTPRQRLELFVPVCNAIQHAHQKGIIHRDIKPSNVMITLYDGKPVPKVIDFGVAKATEQKLTERTLFTQYGTMVGTLEYMSPEQAEMSALGVDTRSDIYSLGVLLYELLTGSTPFTKERFKEAAFDEIRRIIREEEPPKPSTRLSELSSPHAPRAENGTRSVPATLASISANRHTEPAKLTKLVKGELDWIVMKCLEKDRNRRYETANGFAMDVQRYLADEAVLACPPSAAYRLRKFVRRNKAALAMAGSILFFIALLASVVGWAMRDRTAREQEIAQEAARKLALTEQGIRQALDRATASHAELHRLLTKPGGVQELLNQPARWELFLKTAEGELAQARLLAARAEEGLDAELIASADRLEQQIASDHEDFDLAIRLEKIRMERATVADSAFDHQTSIAEYQKAFVRFDVPGDDSAAAARLAVSPIREQLVASLDDWANSAFVRNDKGLAERLLSLARQTAPDPAWGDRMRQVTVWGDRQALEKLVAEAPTAGSPPHLLNIAGEKLRIFQSPLAESCLRRAQAAYPADFWMNFNLAHAIQKTNPAEAVGFYRAALAVRPGTSAVYHNLGTALHDQKKLPEAIDAYQKAIALAPKEAAYPYYGLGRTLHAQGKFGDAVDGYRKVIEFKPKDAKALNSLGAVLCDNLKEYDKAVECFRGAIESDRKFADAYCNLGTALLWQGQLDHAVAAYRTAIKLQPNFAKAYGNLGLALYKQRKLDAAVAACRRAIKIDAKHANAYNTLGMALSVQGKVDDAIDAYRKAIEIDSHYAHPHHNLANDLLRQGKFKEAIAAFKQAVEIHPKFAAAHYSLAWQLTVCSDLKLRDPEQALVSARLAVQLDEKNDMYWQGLGYAEYRSGNWKAALRAFEKLKELGSAGDSMEWFPLSMAYWRLGDKDAARKTYDQAVQWMEKHNPKDGFLRGLQVEAAKLMGIELKKE